MHVAWLSSLKDDEVKNKRKDCCIKKIVQVIIKMFRNGLFLFA
jgi:hypothetical protein